MCCGTEAGSYLRLIDSCITQLKAHGPSRTCNESKEEEREVYRRADLADDVQDHVLRGHAREEIALHLRARGRGFTVGLGFRA